jgi:hypothetical protein
LKRGIDMDESAYSHSFGGFKHNVLHFYRLNLSFHVRNKCRMNPYERKYLTAFNLVFDVINNKSWNAVDAVDKCVVDY